MKTKLLLLLLLANFLIYSQTSNIPANVPSNGLIFYYPFNGSVSDVSGNNINGNPNNLTLVSDRFGNGNAAYSFNGINSTMQPYLANSPQVNNTRTITGWFKINKPVSESFDFALINYGNNPDTAFRISFYSKGYLDVTFNNQTISSQKDYFNNQWIFFAFTFNDDTNFFSLYINNVLELSGTVDLFTQEFGNSLRIGKNNEKDFFEGALDDIGLWNRVLTPAELSALYTPGQPQITYTLIPDTNFEKKLIELGIDSGVVDGKVRTSDIASVESLNVSSSSISDLTGIQDFVSLTNLNCSQNSLKALNVSNNTALTVLDCNNNQIAYLDVSNNLSLTELVCYSNKLTALDVKKNTALTKLDSGSNQYTSLDISNNTALTFLGCNTSQLTTIDVSNNTALKLLDCRENKITTLDVSEITTLTELYCQSNELKDLDISKNKVLEFLNCSKNQLTTLDISTNTALVGLYPNYNQLINLNLKNGNNDKLIYLNFKNNPNLTCIQVDDAAFANANWTDKKDAGASFNVKCDNYTLIPDSNFEQKLVDLGIDTDGLNGKITIADASAVTTLDLSNSNIKDLTGIEYFTSLTYLDVSSNQLTTLDVSKNILLETLNASSNQITTLDLSKNTKLRIVYVVNNPLVSLNLRNGNNLNFVLPSNTGKKAASGLYTSFLGLKTLGCIQVDDENYSNANWSNIKESTTTYSNTCKTLGVPESALKNVVIHPNPTKGELHIQNVNLEKANVYNVLGQLVKSFTLNSNNTDNTINLSGLPKGVYYVYLINQDAASAKKVIVE
ncbi:leucine-rich repeat domain-containing protein [Flavobacterium johnsoniae]|uniref:Por secretion system C-terminal sorting domain-containing protein n=1 Tax=Flavobacterium johnsoniae TaxID=986 RepID=A0A1M5H966_FLAJO|nr:leucine-rich repeat domain-containing protein [Flavobacterium johnsoniae]SHG12443.1 Por secretion system C-terminal sorting domain-containing protein [Flavobacterium johnsoniae]